VLCHGACCGISLLHIYTRKYTYVRTNRGRARARTHITTRKARSFCWLYNLFIFKNGTDLITKCSTQVIVITSKIISRILISASHIVCVAVIPPSSHPTQQSSHPAVIPTQQSSHPAVIPPNRLYVYVQFRFLQFVRYNPTSHSQVCCL